MSLFINIKTPILSRILLILSVFLSTAALAENQSPNDSLISEDVLRNLIISTVKKKMEEDQLEVATVTPPRLSSIRNPKRARLEVFVAGEAKLGRIPVEVNLKDKGALLRRQRVFVSIDFYTQAWTLKSDLPAGHVLELSDLKQGRLPSKTLRRGAITQPSLAIGSKLRRPMKANRSLTKADLIIPKLVKRRSIVQLIFNRGGIVITAEGESLGDGQRGDRIKVRNLKSKKIVTGRVIGVNQVDVGR